MQQYYFGSKVDEQGNVICEKTTKNFNPLSGQQLLIVVIVEALEIVPAGSLSPEHLDISKNISQTTQLKANNGGVNKYGNG